jgi:hypothetical protein
MLARGAVLAGLVLALGACDQGLTEVNVDPNAPTNVGAEYILPHTIETGVSRICCSRGMLDDWAQQTAEIQYAEETIGNVRPASMDGIWDGFYGTDLQDAQDIIDKGTESGKANIQGVGMIWKEWLFSQLTDLFGNVPYSEALQGAENTTPAYDAQADIYAGMLQHLADAQAMLGSGGGDFGGGDIFYGNDWGKWKRFANSLRMRLAMRMSEIDPTMAQQEFVAAYNAGGFTSNADNAQLVWPGDPYGNPNWENCICGNGVRDDNSVSSTLVDTLLSLNDPRLKFYAEPAAVDSAVVYLGLGGMFDGQPYNGEFNGDHTPNLPLGNYSRIGDYWRADGQFTPSVILSYAEVLFLEAEAAYRGWISADAGTLYTQAVQAAFDMYTGTYPTAPTAAERDAYLQNARVVYAGDNATGFAQIQLQKWIALYQVGMEAWSNWRRVRIPDLKPGPDLAAGLGGINIIPVRVPYPSNEQSLNNASLMAAVQAQGGGLSLVTNMWWDVNSNN